MPTRIEFEQLQQLLGKGTQLVDVMPPAEYAESHLPGALNLPLKELDRDSAAQLDRKLPVVVYCYDYL